MKRLLHLVSAAAALACFGACLYAIFWMWTVKEPALKTAKRTFDEIEKWLSIADKAVDDVKGNLVEAQINVRVVQGASSAGANGAKPGFMDTMFARAAVRQMTPNVNQVQHTVEKVTEASIVINSILDSLQEVPLDSTEKLDTAQVQNLQTQLVGLTKASLDLSNLLQDPHSGNGENAAAKSDRIAAGLAQVIVLAGEFQKRVKALRTRVERIHGETVYWMNLTPTLATIILAWVAISQLVVLVVVLKAGRRGKRAHDRSPLAV